MIRTTLKLITVAIAAQRAARKAAVLRPVAEVAAKQVRKRRAGAQWRHVEPPVESEPEVITPRR